MQRTIQILIGASALVGVAVLAVHSAAALPAPDLCCACVDGPISAQPSIPAFFCGLFPAPALPAEEARCEAFAQNATAPNLVCTNSTGTLSDCRAAFAESDIACPGAAGAPTASSGALSVLVALLGAGGYFAARRRSRQPRA